jgi:hypothetical protein
MISDMPGIPKEVIEHKLEIDSLFKPIKQKKDIHQKGTRPLGRKSIGYSKLGSSGQYIIQSSLANAVLVEKPDGS